MHTVVLCVIQQMHTGCIIMSNFGLRNTAAIKLLVFSNQKLMVICRPMDCILDTLSKIPNYMDHMSSFLKKKRIQSK